MCFTARVPCFEKTRVTIATLAFSARFGASSPWCRALFFKLLPNCREIWRKSVASIRRALRFGSLDGRAPNPEMPRDLVSCVTGGGPLSFRHNGGMTEVRLVPPGVRGPPGRSRGSIARFRATISLGKRSMRTRFSCASPRADWYRSTTVTGTSVQPKVRQASSRR